MCLPSRTLCAVLISSVAAGALAAEPGPRAGKERRLELAVTARGFEPSPVSVRRGEPLVLVVTRTTDSTCAKRLVLDEAKLDAELPLNRPVELRFTPPKAGQITYGCQMGKMIAGVLVVE
ncbi:MAG: cupredoxin domain-containing protein [Archangiaceae bacterium]|nr:cupredoxin domain-containing protein [Archangiaceae bacterium]